jgi:hypothetical protein
MQILNSPEPFVPCGNGLPDDDVAPVSDAGEGLEDCEAIARDDSRVEPSSRAEVSKSFEGRQRRGPVDYLRLLFTGHEREGTTDEQDEHG